MFYRTALTAIVLTYLICVLILNGVQKEDLDINTLTKLKQHNFDLDDLNNETVRKKCLELQASKMVDSIVSKLETVEDKRNSFTSISPIENYNFSDKPTVTSQKPPKEDKQKLNSENPKNLNDHKIKKIVENVTLAPTTNYYESSTEKATQSAKPPLSIWEILQSLRKNKETLEDIYNYKLPEITTTTQPAPKKSDIFINNDKSDLIKKMEGLSRLLLQEFMSENIKPTVTSPRADIDTLKQINDYFATESGVTSNFESTKRTDDVGAIIDVGFKNNKFKDILTYVNTAISMPSNEKVEKGKKCCIVNNNLYSINGVKHVNNNAKENNTNIIPKNILQEITEQVRKTIMKDVIKELSNTRNVEVRTTAASTPAPKTVSNDTIAKITRTVIDSMLKNAIEESPQRIVDKINVPSLETIMLNSSETKADTIPRTYILPHVSRLTQLVLPYSYKKNSFLNFYENTQRRLGPIYTQKSELNIENETPNDEKYNENMSKNIERYFLKYPVRNLPDISFPEPNNNRQVNNINIDIPSSTTSSPNPKNINQNSNNTKGNREQFMKLNYPYNMAPGPSFMPVEIKVNNSFQDLSFPIQSLKGVNQPVLTPISINPYNIDNAYNIYRNAAQKTDVMKNWPKVETSSTSTTTTTIKPEITTKISETSKVLDQLKVLFKELDSIKREIAPKKEHDKESEKNNNIRHSHAKSQEDNGLNMRNPYILSQKKVPGVVKPKYIPAKTIQTNRDSIPPLGIPLSVKKNPFSVLIVNQNIIVTSTTKKPHYYEPRKPEVNVRSDRRNDYRQSNNMYNDYYDDIDKDNQEPYYDVTRKPQQLVAQNTRSQTRNKNYKSDSFSYNEYSVPLQPYPQRPNPPWNDEKFAPHIRSPESNLDNYSSERTRKFNPREKIETYDFKRKKYLDDDTESSGRTNQQEMESSKQQGKVENPQYNEDRPQERAVEQREGNAFQKLPEVRLEKDRKLMGVDTDASSPTASKVPQRQQLPLKKRASKYDTHFKDFMKSQQKVNAMLEKILATRIPSALIL